MVEMFTIYLITDRTNGKVYVGQTSMKLQKRWYYHTYAARTGKGAHCKVLCAAIRKHGEENFTIESIVKTNSEERMEYLEEAWISAFHSRDRMFGYNIAKGGKGNRGYTHTAESKAAIGAKHKGKVIPQEIKEKLRIFSLQRKQTDAAKAKLSALRGELANHFNHNISTEEIVKMYNQGLSQREIASELGVSQPMIGVRLRGSGVKSRKSKTQLRKEKLLLEGRSDLVNPDSKALDELYRAGSSCREIGILYEMTEGAVSDRLRKFGTEMRPRFGNKPKTETTELSESPLPSSTDAERLGLLVSLPALNPSQLCGYISSEPVLEAVEELSAR